MFPDARVTLQDVVEQGDTVGIRYVITGTQRQAFLGIPAAGQTIQLPGLSFLLFRDDKCVERWACSDSMVLLSQLRGAEREVNQLAPLGIRHSSSMWQSAFQAVALPGHSTTGASQPIEQYANPVVSSTSCTKLGDYSQFVTQMLHPARNASSVSKSKNRSPSDNESSMPTIGFRKPALERGLVVALHGDLLEGNRTAENAGCQVARCRPRYRFSMR